MRTIEHRKPTKRELGRMLVVIAAYGLLAWVLASKAGYSLEPGLHEHSPQAATTERLEDHKNL